MRITEGNGGWVCADGVDELPPDALLYVRFQPDDSDRLRATELYVDAAGAHITGKHMRELPLHVIETLVNEDDSLRRLLDAPGPQLAVLASHFGTTFGRPDEANWVNQSMLSQLPGSGALTVAKEKLRPSASEPAVPPLAAPQDGMTDEWLRHLAAAYRAAVRRGEAPAKSLAEQAGVPVRTVHSWLYRARKRGYIAPGRSKA